MENPFELILEKLNTIENLLRSGKRNENITVSASVLNELLNMQQASEYLNLSKSSIYKLTMKREIPHFKRGKLYFKRSELQAWMTTNRIETKAEIESMANDYLIGKGRRRF